MGARERESAPTVAALSAVYETNSLHEAAWTHARSVLSVFMGVHRPKHEAPSTLRALNFIDRRISALSYITGTLVDIHAHNHIVHESGREMSLSNTADIRLLTHGSSACTHANTRQPTCAEYRGVATEGGGGTRQHAPASGVISLPACASKCLWS